MQAHNNSIEEFLGTQRTIFVVPVYQRNYDWLDGNCEQLFYDMIKVVEVNKPHFLGTICFKSTSSHEKSIIDGQQRLTSITLILRALEEVVEDEEIKKEIRTSYLLNQGHSIDTDYLRVKLHLNERDDEVYRAILNNSFPAVKSRLNSVQLESRIFQNYKLFIKLIQSYFSKGGTFKQILDALALLSIIELEIQTENPQEIFESLNSTGLDLTNVDLLRNYLLMQFAHDEQTSLYREYWSKIEDCVGVDNMEEFFVDYLIFKKRSDAVSISGRRSHINERTLYKAFKDYYSLSPASSPFERTKNIFKDMLRCAELYSQTVFKPDVSLEHETKLRKKLFSLLEIMEATKARCLLLDLLEKQASKRIRESQLDEAITAITSYSFRTKVCSGKGMNRQFAGNVMTRIDAITDYKTFTDQFWTAMCFGRGESSFPNDEEFVKALSTNDIYLALRSKGTKYLLYSLEENSPRPRGLTAFSDETLTVEHIMPQSLNTKWKTYLGSKEAEDYLSVLHRLGNLTLTSYNSEMSNKSFDEKKEVYAASNFYYTRDLQKVQKWNFKRIQKRGEALAKIALKAWPLPKSHQTVRAPKESLHQLDEDFTLITSTKPSKIYMDDEEYLIDNWSEFVPTVCERLKSINEEVFLAIINPAEIRAFSRDDDQKTLAQNPDYIRIVDDIFINRKKSAYDTLSLVAKIIKTFDEKAETSVFESTLFEIR